ncbi:MAG: hypothetical protein OEL20_05685 [Sulfuritalea sp.]|nr:hypothetical protein [Sulfuritalea sp.]
MTYEEYLDEVTTLITEQYVLSDEAAIRMVMRAQADDFFSGHDDDPSICTLERAHQDAKAVFKKYKQNVNAKGKRS